MLTPVWSREGRGLQPDLASTAMLLRSEVLNPVRTRLRSNKTLRKQTGKRLKEARASETQHHHGAVQTPQL